MAVLEISGLRKSFGTHEVLSGIDFSIEAGELVGLVGENGAGKSTLMKLITGILRGEGSVRIMGHDIATDRLAAARHIGYLPESNPLYDELYIGEYLTEVGAIYGMKRTQIKSRAEELVRRLSLADYMPQRIGTLSKGTRQRVGLAAALIHDPKLLVLDEPTTGLDPRQLSDFHKLISEISAERAILLSTHIMQEISAICTRVVLLRGGVLTQTTAEKIQQEFQ